MSIETLTEPSSFHQPEVHTAVRSKQPVQLQISYDLVRNKRDTQPTLCTYCKYQQKSVLCMSLNQYPNVQECSSFRYRR